MCVLTPWLTAGLGTASRFPTKELKAHNDRYLGRTETNHTQHTPTWRHPYQYPLASVTISCPGGDLIPEPQNYELRTLVTILARG